MQTKRARVRLADGPLDARALIAAVEGLGVPYTWHHTYVAGDKMYCVHETDDAETVRDHARAGGFPADLVVQLAATFGPASAKG